MIEIKICGSFTIRQKYNILGRCCVSPLTNPTNITDAQERQERKIECEHRERLPDKYFFTDVGLRNARLNSRQIDSDGKYCL